MDSPNGQAGETGGEPAPAAMKPPPAFGLGRASDRLGWWSLYFIAKVLLFWRGLVGFHLVENLVLLALLAGPLAAPRFRRYRPWVGVPAAAALLYYDSWLPSASRVLAKAGLVSGFSADYLAELAGRFVSVPVLAMLAVAAAAWFVVARLARTDVFALAATVAAPLLLASAPPPGGASPSPAPSTAATNSPAPGPDAQLEAFYRQEAPRAVPFAKPPEASPPFDIVFLHVCSLSWDDLKVTGGEQHPFLKSFDIVLRRFNSVSTYSGPSVIRILRARCGQQPQAALYSPAPERCLLLAGLEGAGFETNLVLNHDGHFDDFLKLVKAQGVAASPMPLAGIPAPQRSFDESRIHDDQAVLSRWLEARGKSPAARVAAFYNTVSLHDGNRLAADPGKASRDTYKARQAKLLDDLDAFVKKLEASGRRAVVVLVPEHGAAMRGDAMQIAGLREIPSPAITLVPVAIRVVGARRAGDPVTVDQPASYLALSQLVARLLEKPPFGPQGFRPGDYTAGLPVTDFVGESEAAIVLRQDDRFLVRQEKDAWRELPAPAMP